ncbi:hypothetical protein V8G54_026040, partial [Vigna mungo]
VFRQCDIVIRAESNECSIQKLELSILCSFIPSIQAGRINEIDVVPHDNAVYRAQLCSSIGLYLHQLYPALMYGLPGKDFCIHAMWLTVVFEESLASNCKGLKMSLGGRSVHVQFFGTHDFARVRLEQVKSFLSGLFIDLHSKCKKHSFIEALEEAKRQGSPGQRMGPTTRSVGNTQTSATSSTTLASALASADWKFKSCSRVNLDSIDISKNRDTLSINLNLLPAATCQPLKQHPLQP